MLVNLDIQIFDPEPSDVWLSAEGEHDLVASLGFAVIQTGHIFVACFIDACPGVIRQHGNSPTAHLIAQVLADFVVESPQDVHAAADQRDFTPEPGEYAGELHRDVAATMNE